MSLMKGKKLIMGVANEDLLPGYFTKTCRTGAELAFTYLGVIKKE